MTGEPIKVTMHPDGESEWSPANAAVLLGCTGSGGSTSCTCPHTTSPAFPDAGRALLDETPGCAGQVLSTPNAVATGRDTFRSLLPLDC